MGKWSKSWGKKKPAKIYFKKKKKKKKKKKPKKKLRTKNVNNGQGTFNHWMRNLTPSSGQNSQPLDEESHPQSSGQNSQLVHWWGGWFMLAKLEGVGLFYQKNAKA
jgi:hypothetical protein